MGEPEPEAEPSTEEILASIRRILNDDGDGAPPPGVEALVPPAVPEPVFQLDESMIVGSTPETRETDVNAPPETPSPSLVQPETAQAATQAMGSLRQALSERQAGVGRAGVTIEDIVRDELRPLLKTWLDTHLPALVERVVRGEIARLADRE